MNQDFNQIFSQIYRIKMALRDRETRFDLAKSGIIGKILMSRANGRPLKNFKVML